MPVEERIRIRQACLEMVLRYSTTALSTDDMIKSATKLYDFITDPGLPRKKEADERA